MRLHLVEFREENDFFPLVVASPQNGKVRTEEELEPNEILDFQQVVLIYWKFRNSYPHIAQMETFGWIKKMQANSEDVLRVPSSWGFSIRAPLDLSGLTPKSLGTLPRTFPVCATGLSRIRPNETIHRWKSQRGSET